MNKSTNSKKRENKEEKSESKIEKRPASNNDAIVFSGLNQDISLPFVPLVILNPFYQIMFGERAKENPSNAITTTFTFDLVSSATTAIASLVFGSNRPSSPSSSPSPSPPVADSNEIDLPELPGSQDGFHFIESQIIPQTCQRHVQVSFS